MTSKHTRIEIEHAPGNRCYGVYVMRERACLSFRFFGYALEGGAIDQRLARALARRCARRWASTYRASVYETKLGSSMEVADAAH
jgi:hypothetical protein